MPSVRVIFRCICLTLLFSFSHSSNTTKAAVCPVAAEKSNNTHIDSDDPLRRFTEISGLCVSTQYTYNGAPVMYGLADIGDGARFGVWDSVSGKRLLTWQLPDVDGISNVDWESMDIGTCGGQHKHKQCLYIVDAGDNLARASGGGQSGRSSTYKIIRVLEPNYVEFSDNDELSPDVISVLPFEYTDSSSPTLYADSEASFIDHTGWGEGNDIGDFYIVTKWSGSHRDNIRLFRFPAHVWPEFGNISDVSYAPEAVDLGENAEDLKGSTWTRAGMSYDGTVIAFGDTQHARLFLRCPGQNITDALNSDACYTWSSPSRGQVETFAWTPDGMANFQVPEGDSPAIGFTKMSYEVSRSEKVCPSVGYDEHGICRNQQDCSTLPDSWCKEGAVFYNDPSILFPIPCGATRSDFVSTPSVPATLPPVAEDEGSVMTQIPVLNETQGPTYSLTQMPTRNDTISSTLSPSKQESMVRTKAPQKSPTMPHTMFPTNPPKNPNVAITLSSGAFVIFSLQTLAILTGITAQVFSTIFF